MFNKYSLFFSILVVFASCTRFKDITYLGNLKPSSSDSLYKSKLGIYKIQPADILYLKISSIDENIDKVFNQSSQSGGQISSGGGFYITGYTVELDGTINLPVLGRIIVSGFTVPEAQIAIQKITDKYITNAIVELRLVSFKISLLGEVKHPGQLNVFSDKANIFEVIALAGDLTYYANRKNILLMRSFPEGTKTYWFDLTDKSILTSDLYYIQPNDIIYVAPLKSTGFRLSIADYSLLISTLTVTLSTVFLIKNSFK
jgi:polysaccharide export outer membrane protein